MDRGDEPAASTESLPKTPAPSPNAGSGTARTCPTPWEGPSLLREGLPVVLMTVLAVACCLVPILILAVASLGIVALLARPLTWAVGTVLLAIVAAVWILYVKFRHLHRTGIHREGGVPPDRLRGTVAPVSWSGPSGEWGGPVPRSGRNGNRFMEREDDRGGE